jgi:hypothetical protein
LRFKIRSTNAAGFSFTSDRSLKSILAGTPGAPSLGPVRDSVTSGSVLKVTYSPPNDSGSPISNYEVQMDDGIGGGFSTVAGGENQAYLTNSFIAMGGGTCLYNTSAGSCITTTSSYGLDG